MRVAVLTISDSVSKGEREDLSGPAVVAFCRGLGWEVTSSLCVSDDPANIREQLRAVADSSRVDVLLTTGGTGIGPRDNTPEATQAVADRLYPDFPRRCAAKGWSIHRRQCSRGAQRPCEPKRSFLICREAPKAPWSHWKQSHIFCP